MTGLFQGAPNARISIVARSHDPRIVRCEFSLIDRPRVRHPTEGEVPGRTLKGVPIRETPSC